MKLDYGLFMAEKEGYLDTRESKIQSAIQEFVRLHNCGYNINSSLIQAEVFQKCKLDLVTTKEENRIIEEVEKRI